MLRSTADGEWMPFILCYYWDINVDVISRFKVEELGTFDHQVSYLKTEREIIQLRHFVIYVYVSVPFPLFHCMVPT